MSDPSTVDRFFGCVEPAGDCWVWRGVRNRLYGQFNLNGGSVRAHRWAYEYLRDSIPDGLTIDHLCRNTFCVNPWHLEPVPRSENARRQHEAKTHCLRGHEFTPENTARRADGNRCCRQCRRVRGRESMRRLRARRSAAQTVAAA